MTLTLLEAAYERLGKTLRVRFLAQVTYSGSPPDGFQISLPEGLMLAKPRAGTWSNPVSYQPVSVVGQDASDRLSVYVFQAPLVSASGEVIAGSFEGQVR